LTVPDAFLVSLRRKGNSPISDGLYALKISRPLRPLTPRRCYQDTAIHHRPAIRPTGPTRRIRKRRCQKTFGNSKTKYDIADIETKVEGDEKT
jgi:hypothetical protein